MAARYHEKNKKMLQRKVCKNYENLSEEKRKYQYARNAGKLLEKELRT